MMNFTESPWKGTVMGVLLLAVLGLLFFCPLLAGDRSFSPVHTGIYPPWRNHLTPETLEPMEQAANPMLRDKVFLHQPRAELAGEAYAGGKLPLWDPYTAGGVPLMAQGVPSAFHLLDLWHLFLPPEEAYLFSAFLTTVLGAVFMLLFLRALEIRHFAATLGGLAFGFSGWMVTHLHLPPMTGAAIWLPLILLGVEKLLRTSSRWWVFAVILGASQTLLAGYPQIAAINCLFTACFLGVRTLQGLPGNAAVTLRRAGLVVAGLLLGVLLAGIQILPAAQIRHLPDTPTQGALEPACLLTYLLPDLFTPHRLLADQPEECPSLLAEALLNEDARQAPLLCQGYVGMLPLLLAILLIFAGPRRGWLFFAAALVVSLLFAMGRVGLPGLAERAPFLLEQGLSPFLFPAAVCLAVLAAFTLDAFWKPGGTPRVQIVGFSCLVILVLVVAGAWLFLTVGSDDYQKELLLAAGLPQASLSEEAFQAEQDHLTSVLLVAFLHMVLAAVVLLLNTGWTRDFSISRPLVVAVLVLDLFGMGWRYNRPQEAQPPLFDPADPVVTFLEENTGEYRIGRFMNENLFPANAGAVHRLADVQGRTDFLPRRLHRFFELLQPVGLDKAFRSWEALASPLTDLLCVKYVLSQEPGVPEGWSRALQSKNVTVLENRDVLPRAFLHNTPTFVTGEEEAVALLKQADFNPRNSLILEGEPQRFIDSPPAFFREAPFTAYEAERVELKVEGGPGWLVLNDPLFDGWTATLDDEPVPILPANLCFRAVTIPDEFPHKVVFTYAPLAVERGGWLSLAGLGGCFLLVGLLWFVGWKKSEPDRVFDQETDRRVE